MAKAIPRNKLMTEAEWRGLGVQQSQGWVHYMLHEPEPHILLFRRLLPPSEESSIPTTNGSQQQQKV